MKKAADFLEQVLSGIESLQPGESEFSAVFRDWEQTVGKDLAAHSRVKEIEKGYILVEVDHPGWAQLASMNRKRILRRIHDLFPELSIEGMRIVVSGDTRFKEE